MKLNIKDYPCPRCNGDGSRNNGHFNLFDSPCSDCNGTGSLLYSYKNKGKFYPKFDYNRFIGLMKTIYNETRPIDGHPDSGAIIDCFDTVKEMFARLHLEMIDAVQSLENDDKSIPETIWGKIAEFKRMNQIEPPVESNTDQVHTLIESEKNWLSLTYSDRSMILESLNLMFNTISRNLVVHSKTMGDKEIKILTDQNKHTKELLNRLK